MVTPAHNPHHQARDNTPRTISVASQTVSETAPTTTTEHMDQVHSDASQTVSNTELNACKDQDQAHGNASQTVSMATITSKQQGHMHGSASQAVCKTVATTASKHVDQVHGNPSQTVSKTGATTTTKHQDQRHSNPSQTVSKSGATNSSKHRVHGNAPPAAVSKTGVSTSRPARTTHQVHAHHVTREQIAYIVAWQDPLHQHKVQPTYIYPHTATVYGTPS